MVPSLTQPRRFCQVALVSCAPKVIPLSELWLFLQAVLQEEVRKSLVSWGDDMGQFPSDGFSSDSPTPS